MQKHLEEIFELREKDLDFLLNEAQICSLNISLDLQADAGELFSEDMRELGLLYDAIKSKALSERLEYFNRASSLYERAVNFKEYECAGEIKKNLDFFVHSFLEEVPLKVLDCTPSSSARRVQQTGHR
jgi:hypothetical protein